MSLSRAACPTPANKLLFAGSGKNTPAHAATKRKIAATRWAAIGSRQNPTLGALIKPMPRDIFCRIRWLCRAAARTEALNESDDMRGMSAVTGARRQARLALIAVRGCWTSKWDFHNPLYTIYNRLNHHKGRSGMATSLDSFHITLTFRRHNLNQVFAQASLRNQDSGNYILTSGR